MLQSEAKNTAKPEDLLEAIKKWENHLGQQSTTASEEYFKYSYTPYRPYCPGCGRCPTCGRIGWGDVYPSYPSYPYYPYNPYPWQQQPCITWSL